MQKILLTLIIILFIPAIVVASVSEKRVALIIGNAAYKSMPLQNTLNDARAMENALRECDFQIIRELDASRTSMRQAIRTFGDKIKGGGVGSIRMLRGGGWIGSAQYCRSADREGSSPGYRSSGIGLRLSRTLKP